MIPEHCFNKKWIESFKKTERTQINSSRDSGADDLRISPVGEAAKQGTSIRIQRRYKFGFTLRQRDTFFYRY